MASSFEPRPGGGDYSLYKRDTFALPDVTNGRTNLRAISSAMAPTNDNTTPSQDKDSTKPPGSTIVIPRGERKEEVMRFAMAQMGWVIVL